LSTTLESLVSRPTFAAALVKLHALDGTWAATFREVRRAMAYGQYTQNISVRFADLARGFVRAATLEQLAAKQLPHPMDTHPPLSARLAALGMTIDQVGPEALDIRPAQPALSLFTDPELIETTLTDAYFEEDTRESMRF
jgi:hypothetical protein